MVFGFGKKKKKAKKRPVKRKAKRSKKKKSKKKAKKRGGKKKPFGGIVIVPDAKMAAIIGKKPLPPSKMTKAIWVYIKRHKLMKR